MALILELLIREQFIALNVSPVGKTSLMPLFLFATDRKNEE
jgi:hypothetical protein